MASTAATSDKAIESKRKTLAVLEEALKRRIVEFKELCLKEGEIIGHLPQDYPLQQREPIPQIRRRLLQSYQPSAPIATEQSQPKVQQKNHLPTMQKAASTTTNYQNVNHIHYGSSVSQSRQFNKTSGAKLLPLMNETKPFRSNSEQSDLNFKYEQPHQTTAQLANSVKMRNIDGHYIGLPSYDQIAAYEGRLVEATKQAIAANPALATHITEKLGHILPYNSRNPDQHSEPETNFKSKTNHMSTKSRGSREIKS